ncbi:PLCL-like protein [Mya arenaria]|uniref:PLCL-like protein n=2 Tax=Mya arenaria TaxID=6604 RepID=A0ABY7EWI1_MYAAR|nr:PLCL-like protein [Mya arenaria]
MTGCFLIDRLSEMEQRLNKMSLEQEILTRKLSEKLAECDETEKKDKRCKDGWTRFKESCYKFGDSDLTFDSAQEYCKNIGASLVHIDTTEENVFLRGLLRTLKSPKHWIGMTDEAKEGNWTYLDGKTVSFTDWGTYQPNNGRVSNCGAFWESFGYLWVDKPCTNTFKPICEM